MKKVFYFLIIIVIYLLIFFLVSPLANSNIISFYGIIAGLLILALLNIRMIFQHLAPLKMLEKARDSLKMSDFSQKFKLTGQKEMDGLITIYNQMLNKLREERIKITENDHFLESLLNDQPNGIVILDKDSIGRLNPAAQRFLSLSATDIPKQLQAYEKGSMLEVVASLEDNESKLYSQNNLYFYQLEKKHYIDNGKKKYFVVIKELYSRLLEAEQTFQNNILKFKMNRLTQMKQKINEIFDKGNDNCKNKIEQLEKEFLSGKIDNTLNEITNKLDKKQFSLHNAIYVSYLKYQDNNKIKWDWELQDDDIQFVGDERKLQDVFTKIIAFSLQNIGQSYGKITLTSLSSPQDIITITDDGNKLTEKEIKSLFAPEIIDEKNIDLVYIREILIKHHIKFEYFITEKGNNFRLYF